MKGWVIASIVFCGGSVAGASCVTDREQPVQTLSGVVQDRNKKAVSNAKIRVDTQHKLLKRLKSDKNGRYRIPKLDRGHYWVTVDAEGFIRYTYRLHVGDSADSAPLEVVLSPSSECKDILPPPKNTRSLGATRALEKARASFTRLGMTDHGVGRDFSLRSK